MTRRFQVVDERVNGNKAASRKACEPVVDDPEGGPGAGRPLTPDRADEGRSAPGPEPSHLHPIPAVRHGTPPPAPPGALVDEEPPATGSRALAYQGHALRGGQGNERRDD